MGFLVNGINDRRSSNMCVIDMVLDHNITLGNDTIVMYDTFLDLNL